MSPGQLKGGPAFEVAPGLAVYILLAPFFFGNVIKDKSLQTQYDFVKAGFSYSQSHFSDLNRNMQSLINETTGKIKFTDGSMPRDQT